MSKPSKAFPSLSFDDIPDTDATTQARRLQTYSIEALRVGAVIDKLYVQHPDFLRAIKTIDRLFQLGPELDIPQGAYFEGPPGVGKTSLFRFFQRTLPASGLFAPGKSAIGLRVPSKPRLGHFVSALLSAINYPFATGTSVQLYHRRHIVVEGLRAEGTRLLFLDEAQNLIRMKPETKKPEWESDGTEFLRQLMDESHVSVVMVGSSGMDELDRHSAALASRLSVRERLNHFNRDSNWVGLVKAFAGSCKPFDLEFLCEGPVMTRLHHACNGNLREFKRIVIEAVLLAVDSGSLTLNGKLLSDAFRAVYGSGCTRSNPFE